MANKLEILRELKPLLIAFEKHFNEELAELWTSELREYSSEEIRRAARFFLDSPVQKTFPRIGEFKGATGVEKKATEKTALQVQSCPRCTGGLCSVDRELVGHGKVAYTFRCSCPSGDSYPGLPLVNPFDRTKKEEYAEKKVTWATG